jgi:hypothetical protein
MFFPSTLGVCPGERWTGFGGMPSSVAGLGVLLGEVYLSHPAKTGPAFTRTNTNSQRENIMTSYYNEVIIILISIYFVQPTFLLLSVEYGRG